MCFDSFSLHQPAECVLGHARPHPAASRSLKDPLRASQLPADFGSVCTTVLRHSGFRRHLLLLTPKVKVGVLSPSVLPPDPIPQPLPRQAPPGSGGPAQPWGPGLVVPRASCALPHRRSKSAFVKT